MSITRVLSRFGIVTGGAVLALCALTHAGPADGSEPVSVTFDATVNSQYMWRGIALTDEAVFQPSLTLQRGPVSVNLWGNMDLTDTNGNEGEFNEIDYTLDVLAHEQGALTLNTGVIHYAFPNTPLDSTTELYVAAAWDVPASPSVVLYWDIDEADGVYVVAGVGHSVALSGEHALDLAATLGWGSANHNAFAYGADTSAFTDASLAASVTFPVTDQLSLTPAVLFTTILDGDLRDAAGDADNITFGLTASYEF